MHLSAVETFHFLVIARSVYPLLFVVFILKKIKKGKKGRRKERKEETLHDKSIKLQGWFISILKPFFTTAGIPLWIHVNVLIGEVKQFIRLRARVLKPENQREGEKASPALDRWKPHSHGLFW